MRLFVGVELDPEVAAAAASLAAELQRRAVRLAPDARITWIPQDRLHLTIRFIGDTDEQSARAIRAVLEPAVEIQPSGLTIAGTGAFPPKGAPRVLWAGLGAGREALHHVEAEVSQRLESAGVPREERPFSPHLTLARVREASGLRSSELFDGLTDTALGTTQVEAITLFESRLSPKGPTYVPLQRTMLHRGGSL